MGELLDRIDSPEDLKKLNEEELPQVVSEIRDMIIQVTSKTGGHLGASMGATELVVALHYLYDTPRDKLIFDVGHQAYGHKILTGRRDRFETLRQWGGIAGFPDRRESEYDALNVAHGGTSISAALGMATARDLQGEDYNVVAIIGDGSLTAGMAMEGLNNAGHMDRDVTVILNDNKMGISKNVGAMCSYLARIMTGEWANRARKVRDEVQKLLTQVPMVGETAVALMDRVEDSVKNFIVPGMLFEELGFRYIGPVDGHRLDLLLPTLRNVMKMKGPNLVHVVTQKGYGYPYSEKEPVTYHGVTKFDPETGEFKKKAPGPPAYAKVFTDSMAKLSRNDEKIVAISAAMLEGTVLVNYQAEFPDRCFDVGMCEQHAVTFAVGLALQGMKPVAAIYSTFLQRAYDQIIHDVCLTNVPVTFALDRSGLVGDDGPTHQGAFDIAYLRCLPNMVIMSPKDENELQRMTLTAIEYPGPAAVRFPRGAGEGVEMDEEIEPLPIGEAELVREGEDVALIALGPMVGLSMESAAQLDELRIQAAVLNLRFVKPLDEEKIVDLARRCKRLVTIEEGVRMGGMGSAVVELLSERGIENVAVTRLGLPDRFIEHGAPDLQREDCGLTPGDITQAARDLIEGRAKKASSLSGHA
ncbi:MAG: 1-deoxy-D-xylulose-5-phosphate synthase [Nitrospinota bacterium]|jgi:1-deoxy-D-xylulose-5-phosphate synthase|nr:1-deoxy-D-xylulose-5-phosphate synthase [Nitrospinota bacterium]